MTTRTLPATDRRLPWTPAGAPAAPVTFTPEPATEPEPQERPQPSLADGEEVRVTSSTGGAKGVKIAAFDLIPAGPLHELAVHYGKGNIKYPPVNGISNWRNGYPWSSSYASILRHLNAFWAGEDHDPEFGSKHLVAAAWHCLTLIEYMNRPDLAHFDDRQSVITNALVSMFEAQQEQAIREQATALEQEADQQLPAAA